MKTVFVLIFTFVSFGLSAQGIINNELQSNKEEPSVYKPMVAGTQVFEATKYTNRIFTTAGYAYFGSELFNMPTRSVNKIAGLTLGVESFGGNTPVFKGAEGGTAFFVDGVRIRSGALGIAGYSF